jgi:hypothetical protein
MKGSITCTPPSGTWPIPTPVRGQARVGDRYREAELFLGILPAFDPRGAQRRKSRSEINLSLGIRIGSRCVIERRRSVLLPATPGRTILQTVSLRERFHS